MTLGLLIRAMPALSRRWVFVPASAAHLLMLAVVVAVGVAMSASRSRRAAVSA